MWHPRRFGCFELYWDVVVHWSNWNEAATIKITSEGRPDWTVVKHVSRSCARLDPLDQVYTLDVSPFTIVHLHLGKIQMIVEQLHILADFLYLSMPPITSPPCLHASFRITGESYRPWRQLPTIFAHVCPRSHTSLGSISDLACIYTFVAIMPSRKGLFDLLQYV